MRCPICPGSEMLHTGKVTSWKGTLGEASGDRTTETITVICCSRCGWQEPGDWVQVLVNELAAVHILGDCGPGLAISGSNARCFCGWTAGTESPEGMARLGCAALGRIGLALSGAA